MKSLAVLFALSSLALPAIAEDITVINVRRNIPLSDDEPVYKDFYLNGGESAGLKKNLVVTVSRKLTVRDAAGAQAFGDVDVAVGQLRIIAVTPKLAVAREYKLLPRDENPMLEQIGIMSGDHVDLKGAFVDNAKPAKKTAAAAEEPSDVTRGTASAPPAKTPEAASSAAEAKPTTPQPNVTAETVPPAASTPAKPVAATPPESTTTLAKAPSEPAK